jgi:hypothetical protein
MRRSIGFGTPYVEIFFDKIGKATPCIENSFTSALKGSRPEGPDGRFQERVIIRASSFGSRVLAKVGAHTRSGCLACVAYAEKHDVIWRFILALRDGRAS